MAMHRCHAVTCNYFVIQHFIIGASLSKPHIDDTDVCEIYYYGICILYGSPSLTICSNLTQPLQNSPRALAAIEHGLPCLI